jgi:hypothetical protein
MAALRATPECDCGFRFLQLFLASMRREEESRHADVVMQCAAFPPPTSAPHRLERPRCDAAVAGRDPRAFRASARAREHARRNLLIVGSIANIIVGRWAGRRGIQIDWKTHARVGIPVTLMTFTVAAAYLWIRVAPA